MENTDTSKIQRHGKKLLLSTDFSKSSWDAIVYALELYADQECDFYILNAYAKDAYGLNSISRLDPDDAFNTLSENRSNETASASQTWANWAILRMFQC